MFYTLFLTVLVSDQMLDVKLKTYDRFEECWEAATMLVRYRENLSARCQAVDTKE